MRPYIRKLAAEHDLPESAFRCKRGPVSKVITSEAAKVRAQLVVMGTVGRKGIKAKVIGNTAALVAPETPDPTGFTDTEAARASLAPPSLHCLPPPRTFTPFP